MRRIAVLVLAALAGAACGSTAPPAVGAPPDVLLPPPPIAFRTLHGQPADRRTIQLHDGSGHCGWESATFLSIPIPLGQPLSGQNGRRYVRDPGARFADRTAGPFEPSVALPADAVFTGYRYGAMELWVSPEAGLDSVLLGRQGIWERWPRVTEEIGCT